jgi:hypothetical protein
MSVSHPFAATPSQSAHPVLQDHPQFVPSHVAIACGGEGHGEHSMPQVFGLELRTQHELQTW